MPLNTGKTISANAVNLQSSKLSSFIFKDVSTNQKIRYKKLIIDRNTVINSRVYAEPGASGMNVVEFSFKGEKYIQFSAPIKRTIAKQYKLQNGTLTIIQ